MSAAPAECCCNCNAVFKKKKKGFKRTDLESIASPRTVGKVFPDLDPEGHTFVCNECCCKLRRKTVKGPGRKRTFPSNDVSSGTSARCARALKQQTRCIGQAIIYLKNRQYFKAAKALFASTARKSILQVVCKALIEEVIILFTFDNSSVLGRDYQSC